MKRLHKSIAILSFAGSLLFPALPALAEEAFASPEAAAEALVDAARSPGNGRLDQIFGREGKDLLVSGDPEVDKQRLQDFLALAERGRSVIDADNGEKSLVFGTDGWQFPIPLRPEKGQWIFDVAAGKQAIIDRAVGLNETTAIAACADYVAAQNEYFATLHDDEPVQQFAKRFISAPGLHDGLFWEPETPTDRSPLGDKIAAAAAREILATGRPSAYHGYYYRILTRQGPNAPGGAYSYLVGGRLLAGFGLIAFPETWGETGVMTFLCDQRGEVYQKNLGPETAKRVKAMQSLDPGPGWEPVGR